MSVRLTVTHAALDHVFPEIRFQKAQTILSIKQRLQSMTGSSAASMTLKLRDRNGSFICDLSDNDLQLGFFGVEDMMEIHVIDTNETSVVHQIANTDLGSVEKYEISEEDYDKRDDSFRKWRQRNAHMFKECESKYEAYMSEDCIQHITVGSRCEVSPGSRRGEVAFVNTVRGMKPGYWVGIRFDEPVTYGNGIVKGKRIFECENGYGAFVRPEKVQCGEFPELDLLDSDWSSEDSDF
ncbi:hypothetical protein PCE1_002352 [Barthelona sp. PCE]